MNRRLLLGIALCGVCVNVTYSATLDDITFWTGSGANRAAMVIHWSSPLVLNNTSVPAPNQDLLLAWGYQFDGMKTGADMFNAIVAADPRLYATVGYGGGFVLGLGYDADNDGFYGVTNATTSFGPASFVDGRLDHFLYDPDTFLALDAGDVFWGGLFGPNWELWHEVGGNGGFYSQPDRGSSIYWTPDNPVEPWSGKHGEWEFSQFGIAGLNLSDGSWIGWSVARGGLEFGGAPTSPGNVGWYQQKQAPAMIPEPSSLGFLGLGSLFLMTRRRRKTSPSTMILNHGCLGVSGRWLPAAGLMIGTWLAGASITQAGYIFDPNDFAVEVVSSTNLPGSALYNDPQSVLGMPTTWAKNAGWPSSDPFRIKLVEPAYNVDLQGKKVITTLANNTSITVRMGQKVYNDPLNPYGIDLIVFGNSFFTGSGFVSDSTNMNAYMLTSGGFFEKVLVSVSPDNVNWYTYNTGPYGDDLFPTNAFKWDRQNAQWTDELLDPTKPVNPALTIGDFAGISAADAMDLLDGAMGGTGFDLAASGFAWIEYVRFDGVSPFVGGEIDAVARVRPIPEPASFVLLGLGSSLILRRRC